MVRWSWSWWLVSLASIVCCACGVSDEHATERSSRTSITTAFDDDPLRHASAARESIARGVLPANVDGILARLDALRSERRAVEAAVSAAQLVHERYRRFRDGRDLVDAERRWSAIASSGASDAVRCDALAKVASLRNGVGDRDAARAGWLEYLRRCPDGAARDSVRASLALMDPTVARAASAVADSIAPRGESAARSVARVVIDAGHGGSDPGARGPSGLRESEVALAVSRKVAELLATEHGVDVVMTRDRDVYVPLEDRARRANEAQADLFVSIHCNASPRPEARGVSVYALDAHSPRVERRFARRVTVERELDPYEDAEISHILADLQLASQGARSWRLANQVQRSMLDALRERYASVDDMGVHVARFNVLVGTEMPAILIELSFISNPMEESRLASDDYRSTLARAIASAVVAGAR